VNKMSGHIQVQPTASPYPGLQALVVGNGQEKNAIALQPIPNFSQQF